MIRTKEREKIHEKCMFKLYQRKRQAKTPINNCDCIDCYIERLWVAFRTLRRAVAFTMNESNKYRALGGEWWSWYGSSQMRAIQFQFIYVSLSFIRVLLFLLHFFENHRLDHRRCLLLVSCFFLSQFVILSGHADESEWNFSFRSLSFFTKICFDRMQHRQQRSTLPQQHRQNATNTEWVACCAHGIWIMVAIVCYCCCCRCCRCVRRSNRFRIWVFLVRSFAVSHVRNVYSFVHSRTFHHLILDDD